MVLKSLELSGFKSFAKKTELEFSSPITAIVGPNGSGKSNVAEGFRFVLGEQSIKSMRGKRTEDLIWNGTPEVSRSSRASVKIKLNNKDNLFNIDFSEVEIERVIHRDASNEYLLNGSQARLKDVIEMVTEANIGTTGHHIISQGEADKVLNVNAKERKGMIEDALGLKIFEIRKDEALRKLEKTQENIKEVSMLRRELAPHIKFLERQVERIRESQELRKELKNLYLEYFKREATYINHFKNEINNKLLEPKKELRETEELLIKAREKANQKETSSPLFDEVEELESEVSSIRERKNALARDMGRIEGEISAEERAIERMRRSIENQPEKSISVQDVSNLRDKIEDSFSGDGSFSVSEIRGVITQIFDNFINNLRGQGSTENQELENLNNELKRKREEKIKLQEKIRSLEKKEKDVSESIINKKKVLEGEKESFREAEKEVYRLQAKRSELKGVVDELVSRNERILLEEEELKRELGEAAVLVDRDAVQYEEFSIRDENGEVVSKEEIISEDRGLQKKRQKDIERKKVRLEDMGQSGSEEILKEHKENVERDEFLASEINDLKHSSEKLNNLISELDEEINSKFKDGISKINKEFESFFSLMFGGGKASLSVVKIRKRGVEEEDEEYEEGVEISVSLPRKRIKSLEMLSGGERALTSIALLFAMSQVNPPPFIILDETDAALDEANSKRYGDMIEELAKDSQLILITHNRETMSRAGVLYGVTMGGDGVSRLLSIKFEEAVEVAK